MLDTFSLSALAKYGALFEQRSVDQRVYYPKQAFGDAPRRSTAAHIEPEPTVPTICFELLCDLNIERAYDFDLRPFAGGLLWDVRRQHELVQGRITGAYEVHFGFQLPW